MIGDGQLGQFDPAHCDDPSLPCRVWRAHSVVDVSVYGLGAISTRMAVSDDCGANFIDAGLVNVAEDFPDGLSSNHEVPSLAYVAGDADPWKLVTFHVFNNMALPPVDGLKRHDYSLAWIGLRSAPSPMGPWGAELKMMAGSMNNPAVGGPARFGSDALVVSEPAILACPGGFWMAYQANVGSLASDMQIRLCRITNNATVKADVGVFFSSSDIAWLRVAYQPTFPALAGMVSLTAPCLFTKNGATWLLATPVDANFRYLGICAFRVADIGLAKVEKSLWWPKLYTFIGTGDFCGAGAYSAHSSGSGICLSNLSLAQSPMFQIIHTGIQVG